MDNTKKTITVKELIKSMSGPISEENPRAACSVSLDVFNIDDNGLCDDGSVVCTRVITKMSFAAGIIPTRKTNYVQVDIGFSSATDADLRGLWEMLQQYLVIHNADDNKLPCISFVFVPLEYKGVFTLFANMPITWSLQPSVPGGEIDTIRILFDEEDFAGYKSSFSEYEKIIAEADKLQDENDSFFDSFDADNDGEDFGGDNDGDNDGDEEDEDAINNLIEGGNYDV